MEQKNKKILIVGSSAKEYVLAKKLKECNADIVVIPGNKRIAEIAECADIRENNVKEILEYALENAVDLTIATSQIAIKNDIASLFQANEQMIFAPSAQSSEVIFSRALTKKFLYKLHIPSPRFGVFDKLQNALDYLKTAQMPQVIHSDSEFGSGDRLVCTSYNSSKIFVEDLFCKNEKRVVLEDYVYGHEFTFYVVTDGYHAVPLATVANYKFLENDDGGLLTHGVGAYTPDYKISKEIENNLLKTVIIPALESLQKKDTPYLGILGIDCVLSEENKIFALNFKQFLSNHDAQAVLSLVNDNLISIFEACITGSFEDYNEICLSNNSSVSCVILSREEGKIINGLDLVDSEITPFLLNKNKYLEYETIKGDNLVITSTASTLSRARKDLYSDIEQIKFDGIKYRTDICKNVENF